MKITNLASLFLLLAGMVSTTHAVVPQLTLEVSPTTLETWISNRSAAAISMDAYNLTSSLGLLNQVTWQSIDDSGTSNPAAVTAALGAGALGFDEFAGLNPFFMAELDPPSSGVWQAGRRWSIGYPFGTSLGVVGSIESDIGFEYTGPFSGVIVGEVDVLPEPASIGILALAIGCLPLVRRR